MKPIGHSILNNTNKGFTLLEVTVAFVVIVFAITGIYLAVLAVLKWNRINKEVQLATFACAQEMETLLAEDWENLPTLDGKQLNIEGLHYPDGMKSNGIVKVDSTYISQNILVVQVTIRWRSVDTVRTISLQTFTEKKP